MLRLLLIISMVLSLHAATPKIFSSVGDPVYRSVHAVRILSGYKTFKSDRKLFSDYVASAEAAKKEGYWLDKYRMLPEAKSRSKSYLKQLRYLQQINAQIGKLVKEATLYAIKKHHVKTYYAIKKSRHPVLRADAQLRRAMNRFERTIKKERKQAARAKAAANAKFLRSYGNLKGVWGTTSDSGETVTFHFVDAKRITIIRKASGRIQTLEGRWESSEDAIRVKLNKITNQREGEIPHSRSASVTLTYRIVTVGKKALTLIDTRRKERLKLARR